MSQSMVSPHVVEPVPPIDPNKLQLALPSPSNPRACAPDATQSLIEPRATHLARLVDADAKHMKIRYFIPPIAIEDLRSIETAHKELLKWAGHRAAVLQRIGLSLAQHDLIVDLEQHTIEGYTDTHASWNGLAAGLKRISFVLPIVTGSIRSVGAHTSRAVEPIEREL
jgi:hypothetical protein